MSAVQSAKAKTMGQNKTKINLEKNQGPHTLKRWSRSPTTKIHDFKELMEVFIWYVLRDSKNTQNDIVCVEWLQYCSVFLGANVYYLPFLFSLFCLN